MELYQVVAISVIVAIAFCLDSTVKLYRYRRRNNINQSPLQFRDIKILRRPNDYETEETRLTYRNWISSIAVLALLLLFVKIKPEAISDAAARVG